MRSRSLFFVVSFNKWREEVLAEFLFRCRRVLNILIKHDDFIQVNCCFLYEEMSQLDRMTRVADVYVVTSGTKKLKSIETRFSFKVLMPFFEFSDAGHLKTIEIIK